MGPLPGLEVARHPDKQKLVERYGMLVAAIRKPISDDEARVLVRLFGPDDCFGIEEALVRIIETAPGWPLWDTLSDADNEWIQMLRERLANAGIHPPRTSQ